MSFRISRARLQARPRIRIAQITTASGLKNFVERSAWQIPGITAILGLIICGALASNAAAQLTRAQGNLILQGFQVFNTQTFNGNGRTCSTCHIPQDDFTLSPADIGATPQSSSTLVGGGTNGTLENSTLAQNFTLFNLTNDTPGQPGTNPAEAGPFRTSMQLSGLALTTLNDCPNATLIQSAIDSGTAPDGSPITTAQITTVGPPIFPFVVGEPIDIDGVSAPNLGVTPPDGPTFTPGYNGIGVFQISKVFNSTTFQYTFNQKLGGGPVAPNITGSGGAVNALLASVNFTSQTETPVPGTRVCSSSALRNLATFPVDTGTRSIELGWAGDGAPNDDTLFTPSGTTDFNCKNTVDAANANPTNLTAVLAAFSMGAVRHHFAITDNRVPGVDFRCPTPTELKELTTFQEYMGRQYPSGRPLELAFKAGTRFPGTQVSPFQPVITFKDSTAELGKTIFLDSNAGCQFCHFNGGASLSASDIRTEPFGNPPQPFPGRNEDEQQNVDLLTENTFEIPSQGTTINNGIVGASSVSFEFTDPGDGSPIEGNANEEFNVPPATIPSSVIPIFNVQSIIEAPRKKSFFHNGAFTSAFGASLEDAISFYFTDAFVADLDSAAFTNNNIFGVALANALGIGEPPTGTGLPRASGNPEAAFPGGASLALATLAGEYFPSASTNGDVLQSTGGQDVLDTLGFFLRALNVVYSIADCERLMLDATSLAVFRQPTTVQVMNCTTDLNDVTRVINGAKLTVPPQYTLAATQAQRVAAALAAAARSNQPLAFGVIFLTLRSMRHSLVTISPDLPGFAIRRSFGS